VPEFTPTEQRILEVLRDGGNHFRPELLRCLNGKGEDSVCDRGAIVSVQQHIVNLRKKLLPIGQNIVCVYDAGRFGYRQVRNLTPANRSE
jgi:hypothetical protein